MDSINSFTRRMPIPLNIIGFSIPSFSLGALESFIASFFFYYYEVELGISTFIIFSIYMIVSIVAMFIPLLLGYLSDRNYGFTRKIGRRLFWLLISGICLPTFTFFLFFPTSFVPGIGIIILFILLAYRVFYLTFSLNYSALLVNKFRDPKERLILATVIEHLSTVGMFISSMLPPLFIVYGNPSTYRIGALFASLIFLITFLIGFPGLLEEGELIDTYFSPNLEPQGGFFWDFFRKFAYAFTQKNYLIYVLRYAGTVAFSLFFIGGMIYYAEYILEVSADVVTLMYFSYISMILVSIPNAFIMSWFLGYQRVFHISGFGLGAAVLLFPLLGFNVFTAMILMGLVGFFFGMSSICLIPLEGDIFDESASIHKKRSEGFFYGLFSLFGGLMSVISSLVTAIVHGITGFVEGWGPQPPSAIIGIWILFSIIPGLIIIGTQFVFLFVYDLKPRKVEGIQQMNKDLGI